MRTHTARAAVFAAALVLAACSNAGADGEAPASGSASGTVAGTSSSATSSGSTTSTATEATTSTSSDAHGAPPSSAAEEHDDGIAWVPFGPAVSGVPSPQPDSYARLYARECDGDARSDLHENERHLYQGGLAACRAVTTNAAGDWATAEQELGQVGNASGLDCMDSQVLRLLQQLVAAHHRHPDAALAVRSSGEATACETGIDSAKVIDGGTALKVEGRGLWGVSSATVNGVDAPGFDTAGDSVIIPLSTPLDPGSTATVVLVQGKLPPQTYQFTVDDTPPPSPGGEASS